jgi:hypothetical protein
MPSAVTEGLGKSVMDRFTAGDPPPAHAAAPEDEAPATTAGARGVTGRSTALDWRHEPEARTTERAFVRRSKDRARLRGARDHMQRRHGSRAWPARVAPSLMVRARQAGWQRWFVATAVVLVAVTIAAAVRLGGGATRTSAGTTRPVPAHRAGSSLAAVPPILTLADDAVARIARDAELLARDDERATRDRQAAHRAAARRARRARRSHPAPSRKGTHAGPTSAASSALSNQSAPSASSSSGQPAAQAYTAPPSTPAPVQQTQAGPTGPGTTVGKNCAPQCS